jgi:hypothetical protein
MTIRHASILSALCLAATIGYSQDWEASLGLHSTQFRNSDALLDGSTSKADNHVRTSLHDSFAQYALGGAYRLAHRDAVALWLTGQASFGGSVAYDKSGSQALKSGGVITQLAMENFHGDAKVRTLGLGTRLSISTQTLGEFSLGASLRRQTMSLDGTVTNTLTDATTGNLSVKSGGLSLTGSYWDTAFSASVTLVQRHRTIRTFQRLGVAFILPLGEQNTFYLKPSDWKLSTRYLPQLQPGQEFQVEFGIRL